MKMKRKGEEHPNFWFKRKRTVAHGCIDSIQEEER